MVSRRKSDDYIGPATGVMRWVNKFFRFVLFPFIHPLSFVVILTVLGGIVVGIHHFFDVAYKDIPSWVLNNGVKIFNDVTKKYDYRFLKDVSKKLINIGGENGAEQSSVNKDVVSSTQKTRDFVSAVERKAFKKLEKKPEINNVSVGDAKTSENVVSAKTKNIDDLFVYKRDYALGLTYATDPRVVKGQISVVNANEIIINNEVMFLYGIYSDPSSDKGIDGVLYLQNSVKGKEAECRIVAYTQNAELTAICVIDGVNINQKMVDMGFSKNVTLN